MGKQSTSRKSRPKTSKRHTGLLIGQLEANRSAIETALIKQKLAEYKHDIRGYCRDILGVKLWEPIADALESLDRPPYKTSVDSGHGVGKTFAAAVKVNHHFDTCDPGVAITTAPTQRDVVDLLWTEIRLQRERGSVLIDGRRLPLPKCFIGPAAPEMRDHAEHYAKGYTARKGESFQGRHRPNMLFVFDEKEGIDGNYWTAAKTMFRPGSGDAWLVIGNPTTTTSVAYQEHRSVDANGDPTWHRVRLSCLDHPNMEAKPGEPLPVPGAVTPAQVGQWLSDWCDPVVEGDEQETDIVWEGKTYRPGPIAEPRILGLRPSAGTYGVWSEALWALVVRMAQQPLITQFPIIGCDVANYGLDFTTFHVRCGGVSLEHQAFNGWGADKILGHLKDLAHKYAAWATKRKMSTAAPVNAGEICIHIDDDATGRAVSAFALRQKLRVVPVNAGGTPKRPDLYANIRSELWFNAQRKAAAGLMNLSQLDRATLQRIEMQAMAPEWWPDPAGRRVVESKDDLRKPERLGRSPDDMDAVNLAYYDPGGVAEAKWVEAEPAQPVSRPTVKVDAQYEYPEPDFGIKLWGRR